MVVMVAAGGGRYWIDGVRGECCRCDGRFRIWESLGEGRVRMGWWWAGRVCVGTSLALGAQTTYVTQSGFPYAHYKASGIDRLPCLRRSA